MPSVSRPPPLPGFGLDLDHNNIKDIECFPSALTSDLDVRECDHRLPLLTLREIAMVQFMNQITDKKEWERKIFDETIAQKWATEAIQSPGADFTKEMADYCISELKYKAKLLKKSGFVHLYNGDVIKSDSVIPPGLRTALKEAVAPLEQVPAYKQDWHPGSDNKVLDLVHPSLFPLVYGTSRILTNRTVGVEDCISLCGQGEVLPVSPEEPPTGAQEWRAEWPGFMYSRKFQWLPCDIDVSSERPKIVSYINNLHPQEHVRLYEVIEQCLEKILPLWNATLTPLRAMKWKPRIVYDTIDYRDLDEYTEREGPTKLDDEEEWEFEERQDEWKTIRKPAFIVKPNPKRFSRGNEDDEENDEKHDNVDDELDEEDVDSDGEDADIANPVDLKKEYSDTGLQIIVKLANIHLTPEKPTYDGGTWHVEGQLNEQICATAIYYYDIENITSSRLAFRQASDVLWAEESISYDQGDHAWLEAIYGLEAGEPAVQVVGSIQAGEGRVVTFPNILQHQVQPFKLADPTKPGHRKILAFFLVDPNIKIISTANIPCQQREWWGKEIVTGTGSALGRLPIELKEKVVQSVEDFPLSLEQAKQFREELMEERKNYVLGNPTKLFEDVSISLCEH